MTSARLIAAFENQTTVPVDLNAAKQWLLENRIQDEINFIPVDLDTGVIRGFLRRVRRPKTGWDLDPDDVSYIYYDRTQGDEWIQLVCAKEMLHILDAAVCSTKEQFDRLTKSLALPNDLRHLQTDPDFALVDKIGSAAAAALLLPWAARQNMMPAYEQGILSDADIAKMAVMPVQHVRTVMSENWPFIYNVIMRGRDGNQDLPGPVAA